MRVLGLEGTAWAASAAWFDEETDAVVMETDAYQPESGGIHPRDAAQHMAEAIPTVVNDVLEEIDHQHIDAVAFSQGPGLGPCLRIVGTAARTLAQRFDVPLVGVNHMLAHLEVGRRQSGFPDPICLNASGANAHVLGFHGGRYRVLGETMDTGVGNALDKFARELGWDHPGGPKIEQRAQGGSYIELPYVVKGMDFSFAGLSSAAADAVEDGVPVGDVCFSLQETVFAMLTEVSERALSLTGRETLVLGGGVGQNARLQEMLGEMCETRGADVFVPEPRFLRDNAAMIAMLGATMAAAGQTIAVEESAIRAGYRPDEVPVEWRAAAPELRMEGPADVVRGAEATVERDGDRIIKTRATRAYRHPQLDQRLRQERTASEARLLSLARRAGVPTPVVLDVDQGAHRLVLEHVGDDDLRDAMTNERVRTVGGHLATLHGAGLIHGDPTPRNVRVDNASGRCYLIDFGLGYHSRHVEDRAMDLHVFDQAAAGTAPDPSRAWEALLAGYAAEAAEAGIDFEAIDRRLEAIGARGRYR